MAEAMTDVVVVEGDITVVECDAIVNAANTSLLGGGGVDGAIHRAAGPTLLEECRDIIARQGGCAPGEAVITGAGELPCRHVIHTVGPVWDESRADEMDATLANAYRNSLALATEHRVGTIAFPNISTGVYRFPTDRAADVAIATVREYLDTHADHGIEQVTFVCFGEPNLSLYQERLAAD